MTHRVFLVFLVFSLCYSKFNHFALHYVTESSALIGTIAPNIITLNPCKKLSTNATKKRSPVRPVKASDGMFALICWFLGFNESCITRVWCTQVRISLRSMLRQTMPNSNGFGTHLGMGCYLEKVKSKSWIRKIR